MFRTLMTSRRFAPLVLVPVLLGVQRQFRPQHAGDADSLPLRGRDSEHRRSCSPRWSFVLPAIPLSALGGEIADSHDKALIARRLKLAEIGVQMVAAAGFVLSLAGPALCRAVRARLHRGAVRPDQIRHSARPSTPRGARLGQRAGRGRDFRRHHLRPDRRRLRGGRRPLGGKRRRATHGRRARLLRLRRASSRRPASARRA